MTFTPVTAFADPEIMSSIEQLNNVFFGVFKAALAIAIPLLVIQILLKATRMYRHGELPTTRRAPAINSAPIKTVLPPAQKTTSNDFLRKYKKAAAAYKQIQTQHASIQDSGMSPLQKERANRLVALADRTIDNMRLLDRVGDVDLKDLEKITGKLASVDEGLSGLVDTYKKYLAGEFDNIEIPDSYTKQDELEELRIKGVSLLSEIKDDSDFNNSEDKFRLNKIVNEQLDDLWANYTSAKASYRKEITNSPFGVKSSTKHNPDDILDIVFASIRSTYKDIENGVKSAKQELAMTKLLTTKNYFESR